jgi:nitroreductase
MRWIMDYESFLELVKSRRSIRRFKPDPISDEYINKIIEAARWAPSGYNSQPWDFFVIQDKKLRQVVASFDLHNSLIARIKTIGSEEKLRLMSHPWKDEDMDYRTAPVFIALFGDYRVKAGLPDMGKTNPAGANLIIQSSLACAFIYMELAATTLGLATQWLSGRHEIYDKLKALLNIPEEFEPYGIMPLGYPAFKPRPKLLRPKDKMIHYNYCATTEFRSDEEVNDCARKTWIWSTATHRRGIDKLSK